MRYATRVWHVMVCGLVLTAVLCWPPAAMAQNEHQDGEASSHHDILNKLHFGPEVYAVERSTSRSGQQRLDLRLADGTSFSYLEGQQVSLKVGGEALKVEIHDHQVRVGKNHWCSSDDIACIVHAIRKQLKHLTKDHSAHGLAALQHTLRSMQFGGPIGHVFHGLATMPVAQDNTQDDNHGDHGGH
jgi:hypothetical protein